VEYVKPVIADPERAPGLTASTPTPEEPWDLNLGLWAFLVPVRGYAKGGDAENVEFVGIAA
jgi:hypothetical protein